MFKSLLARFGYVPASSVPVARDFNADVAAVKKALSGKYEFRTIGALARKLKSADLEYVRGVATAAGARTSYRKTDLFGLKSVVGETGRRNARSW